MDNTKISEKYSCIASCPMRNVIAHFANKWSMLLLVILDEYGVMRFNELSRAIPDISPKVLSGHLKTLESMGLVNRELYAEVPPRTEYHLTDLGKSLIPYPQQPLRLGTPTSDYHSEKHVTITQRRSTLCGSSKNPHL